MKVSSVLSTNSLYRLKLKYFSEWVEDYQASFIDEKALQTEVDNYMSEFDQKKQKEEEEMRMKEGQPDEDGWITVTKQYILITLFWFYIL